MIVSTSVNASVSMNMSAHLAKHHQLHGVQPVLPVPDVAAAADWFVRVLGFTDRKSVV